MNQAILRKEALKCYKQLMKTINEIFCNDYDAISISKQKAREEFVKNRQLNDLNEIQEQIRIGYDSIEILRRTVIQARLNERGNYEATIRTENIDGNPTK